MAAATARSSDTVELLPGKITGSVQFSSETIAGGSVSASATDGSGSASTSITNGAFSLVVPAGKSWTLQFSAPLSVAQGYSQISISTQTQIAVAANQTVIQDFVFETVRVTADVEVLNGVVASQGYLNTQGSTNSSSFTASSQGLGWVLAQVANNVQVWGSVNLLSDLGQSSSSVLNSQIVNVPFGGTSVTWTVNAAFISSTIQGSLLHTGGPTPTSAQVYIYGNDYYSQNVGADGLFQFNNVKSGNYWAYAYTYFGSNLLYLYQNFQIGEGAVETLNFGRQLATARAALEVSGFLQGQQLYGTLYANGDESAYSYSQLEGTEFVPVVSAGSWRFNQLSLSSWDNNGYFSFNRYDATVEPVTIEAGDNVTLPAVKLNTSEAEFTFDVVEAPGATSETLISYPRISGYSQRFAANGSFLGSANISSQAQVWGQAKPRVRIVGEPGTYTVDAFAQVDGSDVSFGSFTIELKAPLLTPVGTDVTVTPAAGVTLEFDHVTTAGVTTASQLPVGPSLPGGFSNLLVDGAKVYFSASTTAVFDGFIDVSIAFDPSSVPVDAEASLRLFYYDKPSESWIDITTSVDEVNNLVTGVAPGLSTFAIGLSHAPVIEVIIAPVSGSVNEPLTFSATFSDADQGEQHTAVWSWGNSSGNTAGVVLQASGSVLGEHTFAAGGNFTGTLTLTDITGHVATKNFTFTITGAALDTNAPVIATGGDLVVEATSIDGAMAEFAASAFDDQDGSVAVTVSHASGSVFPLGTTTVSVSARDAAGNVANASFMVTVLDTVAPVIIAPANLTLEAANAAGAVANFAATATDATGASLSYSIASGSTFAVGSTTVLVTATDGAGNQSSASFTVTVRDTVAPVITSLSTNAPTLWPANHKMVAVQVSVAAADSVGPVYYRIVSVTSNEADNGLGDGDTANDIQITGDLTVNLRAERSAKGNGRTYTLTVEAKDAAGNATTSTVTVFVPKNQSGK